MPRLVMKCGCCDVMKPLANFVVDYYTNNCLQCVSVGKNKSVEVLLNEIKNGEFYEDDYCCECGNSVGCDPKYYKSYGDAIDLYCVRCDKEWNKKGK